MTRTPHVRLREALRRATAAAENMGGLKLDQAKRLKELEWENARLRKAVADLTFDTQILLEVARGNY